MRRMILTLSILAWAPLVQAWDVVESDSSQNEAVVRPAPARYQGGTRDYVEIDPDVPIRRARKPRSGRARVRRAPRARRATITNSCTPFIDTDGRVGEVGAIVGREIMASRYSKQFLSGAGIERYCPRYDSFTNDRQRLRAWVALWSVLAGEESACGANPQTYSRYRAEYGVWQLERSPDKRSYRGPECRDLSTVQDEAACAISIMGDTQFRKGHEVFWSGSYWGPIRRSASQILPKMRRFDFCN